MDKRHVAVLVGVAIVLAASIYVAYTAGAKQDSCADSDNGVATVMGFTSGMQQSQEYRDADSCLDNTTLIEWTCAGRNPVNRTVDCVTNSTARCEGGKCV